MVLKRIFGNIGKPGVVLLTSPQDPEVREVDYGRLMQLSELPFDGDKIDRFTSTSLHLSFTDYHVPLLTGQLQGRQDSTISSIEGIICIRDAGDWVADINILKALSNDNLFRLEGPKSCSHVEETITAHELISVEDWHSVLDCPIDSFIVRAHRNWLARLAIVSTLAQHTKFKEKGQIRICPSDVCWTCLCQEKFYG